MRIAWFLAGVAFVACAAFDASNESQTGTASDGGSSTDAARDAVLAEGQATSDAQQACDAPKVFCADFNDPQAPAFSWEVEAPHTGDTSTGELVLQHQGGTQAGRAWVTRSTNGWPTLRMTFDMFVVNPKWTNESSNAGMTLAGVMYDTASDPWSVFLVAHRGGFVVNVQEPDGEFWNGTSTPAIYDQWVHVVIEVDPQNPNGRAALTLGETVVPPRTDVEFATSDRIKTRFVLGLDQLNAATPAFTVRYDNVRFEEL